MDPNEQKADEQAALVARYLVRVDIAQTRGFPHGLEARQLDLGLRRRRERQRLATGKPGLRERSVARCYPAHPYGCPFKEDSP